MVSFWLLRTSAKSNYSNSSCGHIQMLQALWIRLFVRINENEGGKAGCPQENDSKPDCLLRKLGVTLNWEQLCLATSLYMRMQTLENPSSIPCAKSCIQVHLHQSTPNLELCRMYREQQVLKWWEKDACCNWSFRLAFLLLCQLLSKRNSLSRPLDCLGNSETMAERFRYRYRWVYKAKSVLLCIVCWSALKTFGCPESIA